MQLEKVARLEIAREPDCMYVVRGNKVLRVRRGSAKPEEIATFVLPSEPGWVYCLDKDGDVSRSPSLERSVTKPSSKSAQKKKLVRLHARFAALTSFAPIPIEDARARHRLDAVHDDWTLSTLFGAAPDVAFVHDGAVEVDGDLAIRVQGDNAGVYVLDGDLSVSGLFEYAQIDGASVLYVTGNVRVRDLALEGGAQLWIGKKLSATGCVLDGMSDAGSLLVKGATKATAILGLGRSSSLSFAKKPSARIIEARPGQLRQLDHRELAETALAAPFSRTGPFDVSALVRALRKGKSVLR